MAVARPSTTPCTARQQGLQKRNQRTRRSGRPPCPTACQLSLLVRRHPLTPLLLPAVERLPAQARRCHRCGSSGPPRWAAAAGDGDEVASGQNGPRAMTKTSGKRRCQQPATTRPTPAASMVPPLGRHTLWLAAAPRRPHQMAVRCGRGSDPFSARGASVCRGRQATQPWTEWWIDRVLRRALPPTVGGVQLRAARNCSSCCSCSQ